MDKDTDILINPKSLALFISKILSKNKGNVSKNREGLVALLSDTIESARKKAESSLMSHGNSIRNCK